MSGVTMRDIVIEKLAQTWAAGCISEQRQKEYYELGIRHYSQMSDEDLLWELEQDAYNRGVDDATRY